VISLDPGGDAMVEQHLSVHRRLDAAQPTFIDPLEDVIAAEVVEPFSDRSLYHQRSWNGSLWYGIYLLWKRQRDPSTQHPLTIQSISCIIPAGIGL
jgi:hypothetical protein